MSFGFTLLDSTVLHLFELLDAIVGFQLLDVIVVVLVISLVTCMLINHWLQFRGLINV